jgi:hypothetical protein
VALGHERVAALAAQVDVEDDDVDVLLGERRACRRERLRLDDLVSVELEIDPAQEPDRGLVVNDQDPSRRRMPPGIPHRRESSCRRVGPYPRRGTARYRFEVAKDLPQRGRSGRRGVQSVDPAGLPHPTQRFRREAWLAFQRALDPLAPPKPLPPTALTPPRRPPPADG